MHGIFTRVFLSFWAAIVLIAAAAVAVTTINFRASDRDPPAVTRQAADVLQREGLTGLRTWLADRNKRVRGQRTLIIDPSGRDILGQQLPKTRRWNVFRRLDPNAPPPADQPGTTQHDQHAPQPMRGESTPNAPATRDDQELRQPRGSDTVSTQTGPSNAHDAVWQASAAKASGAPGASPFAGGPPGPPPEEGFPMEMGPPMGPGPGPGFGPPPPHGFPRPPGGRITAADGAAYFVLFDPPPRRGPFSPPFSWPVRGVLLAMAIAISGFVSYLLARSISSPLSNLQAATRQLSTGNLSARADAGVASRKDEFGTLAREFDSMAERLSVLIMARQQLLRDISHELRSPLARLQMALQLLRQDASSTQSQLDRIERESERLEILIDQVLEYARLERDPSTLNIEEVDLIELVRQIVHDAAFESQSAAGRLQFSHPNEVILRADPNLVHAVIDNVVRNALIHGEGQTPIEITVTTTAEEVSIQVRDYGRGVPEPELQKIFEPFYRVVDAASRKARSEGSGIGLAIAARAVALHNGRIAAANAEGGGLRVTITLPYTTRSVA